MVILFGIVLVILLAILKAFIIMVSWNAVVPELFHLPEIAMSQAFWLGVLASALFHQSKVNFKKG